MNVLSENNDFCVIHYIKGDQIIVLSNISLTLAQI